MDEDFVLQCRPAGGQQRRALSAGTARALPAIVDSHAHALDRELWTRLLRRAHVIVAHQRFYAQPIDAREVARRVLATHPAPQATILRYRALLEEAVESFIHGFR